MYFYVLVLDNLVNYQLTSQNKEVINSVGLFYYVSYFRTRAFMNRYQTFFFCLNMLLVCSLVLKSCKDLMKGSRDIGGSLGLGNYSSYFL